MQVKVVSTKAVVTVSEMAKMCSLSRARFYQLVQSGVFPQPVYFVSNRRPIYVEELQEICLEVRRRNCGVNGRPVLFYARGQCLPSTNKAKKTPKAKPSQLCQHIELIEGLESLGVPAKADQVDEAIRALYPSGISGVNQSELLRAVFLHLKCQN